MMRTSILASFSLGTLLTVAGCDPEGEALDDAWVDDDESVSFRCIGIGCVQSPYLGAFDISNLSESMASVASPDGSSTVRWTGLTKGGLAYDELRVTDLAKCEVRRDDYDWEGCEGTIIDLSIAHDGVATAAKIKVESLTTDTSGALDVYKYSVLGNLDPLTGQPSGTFSYPVCPIGDDGTRTLVMLPDVQTTFVVTNGDDGLGELTASTSTKFTLACNGYAQAKGYTRGRVLPASGGARNYGVSNYNGFTHAMRALYREPGTTNEYSALTQHGTTIAIKDLRTNPPLFNELTGTPPIVGYGAYLLESVYNGDPSLQSGRKGATCKKPYVDFPCNGAGQTEFPYGVHRRPEYSPPMLDITGWSSLPDCDMNNLDDFGSVGVYNWYEGQCGGSQ